MMKKTHALKAGIGLTTGLLAAIFSAHTILAQEITVQSAPASATADTPPFRITAFKASQGIDKRLPAVMYEDSVEISPITKNGISLSVLTIEQGAGILIFKCTPPAGVTSILGYMPFDTIGQTVTIRNGVTTYRDREGRTVRVFPPSAPDVNLRYNNDVLNKTRGYLLVR